MQDNRQIPPLLVAAIFSAILPVGLGVALLAFRLIPLGTTNFTVWDPFIETFRAGCAICGLLAVSLAVAGLTQSRGSQKSELFWIALGLGLGETAPIWWIVVEIDFGLLVMFIRVLMRL